MKKLSVFDERRVPRDIRQYVRNRILRRVIPCVVLVAVLVSLLVIFDAEFFGAADKKFRLQAQVLSYSLAVVIPMLITGVPLKLIDSSWEGKVIKVHAYTTIESNAPLKQSRNDLFLQLNVKLTVRTPEGKTIRRKAAHSRASNKTIVHHYQVGDYVMHLYGTDHTVVLSRDAATPVSCVICGRRNPGKVGRCECGYSLMR